MKVKHRDKIAETWFATVFPLDKFHVKEGVLVFEDVPWCPSVGRGSQLIVPGADQVALVIQGVAAGI